MNKLITVLLAATTIICLSATVASAQEYTIDCASGPDYGTEEYWNSEGGDWWNECVEGDPLGCNSDNADAPFCSGPSDQGDEDLSSCEIEERSARGYCPGEPGHQDELDGFEDDQPTNHVDIVEHDEEDEASSPRRPVEVTPSTQGGSSTVIIAQEELPVTGTNNTLLALLGAAMVAAGSLIVRKTA